MKIDMTDDRSENTHRRAAGFATAILHAVTDPVWRENLGMSDPNDPLNKLRMALGRAYSDVHMGVTRPVIVARIRDVLADPPIAAAAQDHQRRLAEVQAARSQGARTGDYVGKVQLELLTEALEAEKEPPHAA